MSSIKSSASGSASALSRRPRLRPKLALGVLLGGSLLALLGAAVVMGLRWSRGPVDHTPRDVTVVPRMRSATLKFTSLHAFAPVVEYRSAAAGPFSTSAASATEHELTLGRLQPGTEYEYRVIAPDQGASLMRRFTTPAVNVHDVRLDRHPDRAVIRFTTDLPVRALVTYWPSGNAAESAVMTRDASTTGGTTHMVTADQLDPDRPYELVLSFVTRDGESAEWPPLAAPSARQILDDLMAAVKRVTSSRLMARINDAQRELDQRWPLRGGRDAELIRTRTARLRGMLGGELDELRRSVMRARPMAPTLFASRSIYLSEKVRMYEFFALAEELQQFLRAQAIDVDLGVDGTDRSVFGAGTRSRFTGEAVPGRAVPSVKLAPTYEGLILDAAFLDRLARWSTTFDLKGAASVKRAQLTVELSYLSGECKLSASINGKARLVFLVPPPGLTTLRPAVLHHELDPELLVEGPNAVEVVYERVVGCLCTESPRLDRVELSVLR